MSTNRKQSPSQPGDNVLDCAWKVVSLIHAGKIVMHRRIGETSLAATFKVSRAVVRSALEHLEMIGLVFRVPRSGTFLKEISLRDFCDVMDIRAALETLAARLAAARAEEHETKALVRQAEHVDALGRRCKVGNRGVISELARGDLDFHLAIATLSGNQRLASTLQQQRLIEFTFGQIQESPPHRSPRLKATPTHLQIAKAIAVHDATQAAELMRLHILRTKESRLGSWVGELA